MDIDTVIEISGTLVGLLYLYWEYKASRKVWYAGIAMPAISLWVYWKSGLYADFGINVYYLVAALYGLWLWRKNQGDARYAPITSMPARILIPLLAAFMVVFISTGFILDNYTPSDVPWWDSFTTALSVVGLWMLARKWVEQWIPWIVVDAVSSALYIYKDIYFYAILYGLYTVVAIIGYFAWKKKMQLS
ncbi:MAG: nicotinamide mononucleotide transporter [Bacteroidaceae bacterium]|nr:nicotinamide mononucleotide transporter [Bacteroidaceae bacterium]